MFKGLLLALFVAISYGLNCNQYEDVYRVIDAAITENEKILPTLVRLGFHDCVGPACDGCLNFEDPNNAGLEAVTDPLEDLYLQNDLQYVLSRSDFWQLAAHVALVRGGLNKGCKDDHCHFFSLQFLSGRKDCRTSPYHHNLDDDGDAHGDWDELERVFGKFDLTDSEMVTLMGCHSLGGAHKENSGFKYNWQEDYLTFDNGYYRNLISQHYKHDNEAHEGDPARYEFSAKPEEDGEELLMLNVDMSLLKDLHAEHNKHGEYNGVVKCPSKKYQKNIFIDDGVYGQVESCKDAPTAKQVKMYAHHLDKFYEDFTPVWKKVVSHGCDGLKAPEGKHDQKCGYCIPRDAYCVSGFEKAGECCPGNECVENKCTKVVEYYGHH